MEEDNNINSPIKGLHTDNSPVAQPEGTIRFGLNGVRETENGDQSFGSNEESNEECAEFPDGFTPIGEEYMIRGQIAMFLTNPSANPPDIIGIKDKDCNFHIHVQADLGFKLSHQIDATYRLRRGCENTIYWVDGDNNKPRVYNFDKPEDFQKSDGSGEWDVDKFNLSKTYEFIPNFEKIELLNTGRLPAGSYNFAVQLLDADFNGTEWISSTDTVVVYHDNVDAKDFAEIEGSTNLETDYQKFGVTGKSIRLTLNNFDASFPFYRLAIIEATNGTGEISRVVFSEEIPTNIRTYTYSGNNSLTEGTIEEVQAFNNVIDGAEHIEQIENRLILSNTIGKKVNFCGLQRYASKINAVMTTKEVILNDVNFEDNQKRGQLHTESLGYMPGEIYSFGIVYIFADGTTTPVYHIPGRHPDAYRNLEVNDQGEPVEFVMSADNALEDSFYTSTDNCESQLSYWGVDAFGEELEGQPVRHHRFPLRSEVNKPLVVQDGDFSDPSTNFLNAVSISLSGSILSSYLEETIQFSIDYEVDGVAQNTEFGSRTISDYEAGDGDFIEAIITSLGDISNVVIKEQEPGTTNFTNLSGGAGPYSGLTYTSEVDDEYSSSTIINDESVYKSEIFGIKFDNIEMPPEDILAGEKVVGYYIVRNERTEEHKTILDSAVLTPLIKENGDNGNEIEFVAHGHLAPNTTNVQDDAFALIHPEHRFNQQEYPNVSEILREGTFVLKNKTLGSKIIEDAQEGTSYDSEAHKKDESDSDGFELQCLNRNHTTTYESKGEVLAAQGEVKDVFYLDTLFENSITDIDDKRISVYNLSSDNKIGIVQLNKRESFVGEIPYVVLKSGVKTSYSSFRVLPYYKETANPIYFSEGEETSSTILFNGDSYISPMNYMSSMYHSIRLRDRDEKSGFLNFLVGALAVIAGAALLIFSAGTATAPAIALIGFGVSQIATGLQTEQLSRVYQELYEQGLKDTVNDSDTSSVFGGNPSDDRIRWFHDSLTDLWFESSVNVNWRMGSSIGLTSFLTSPSGYNQEETLQYCTDKVTFANPENDGGRQYQGFAAAEIYELNPDYARREKEKQFSHLGIEYDCCSNCREDFPHRSHFSEQSFQEELTDNYRTFLPNNYRDLEGERGEITDIFRFQNNLYIHTEEALWHLPQNIQERVTDDIVSFIGTGDFFNIPPRLIVDDSNGHSAGTKHKWSTIKTPHGVFFISELEGVVYQFNGKQLIPISNRGNYNWFKNNLELQQNKTYRTLNQEEYPHDNNPSNPLGTGFISTYDSRKERLIFTKKDFVLNNPEFSEDYIICTEGGNIVVFPNAQEIIDERAEDGWMYQGIVDCEMSFTRVIKESQTFQTFEIEEIPNDTIVIAAYDSSGSFSGQNEQIQNAVEDWYDDFIDGNDLWEGELHHQYNGENSGERWLGQLNTAFGNQTLAGKNVLLITFANENSSNNVIEGYHSANFGGTPSPTSPFNDDLNTFLTRYNQLNSFIGISYPIVFNDGGNQNSDTRQNLLHQLSALTANSYSATEVAQLLPNPGMSTSQWNTLTGVLQGNNNFTTPLEDYNWQVITDKNYSGGGNEIISPEAFALSVNEILEGKRNTITIDIDKEVDALEYETVSGTVITDLQTFNNSWTISYHLKSQSWGWFHSYLPSFYSHTPNNFYSWIPGDNNLWKHNRKYHYQNFYGKRYPFIVEFVSANNPLTTKIWDYITLITEAKRYVEDFNEQVEERFITFNKALFYNSRQSSGVLNLLVKDISEGDEDYLLEQVQNFDGDTIVIDKNEKNWNINDLRDIRTNYSEPIFNSKLENLQEDYFIDKVINDNSHDPNKDWTEMESFRDKYLVIRLIFDTFDDVKLILNYSVENEKKSPR